MKAGVSKRADKINNLSSNFPTKRILILHICSSSPSKVKWCRIHEVQGTRYVTLGNDVVKSFFALLRIWLRFHLFFEAESEETGLLSSLFHCSVLWYSLIKLYKCKTLKEIILDKNLVIALMFIKVQNVHNAYEIFRTLF